MTETVRHRGPDGSGITYLSLRDNSIADLGDKPDGQWQVALGHRRLSILDLSEAGKQPMSYRGRLWLTYNGEIYNYIELRQELERLGHEFRSHSDTEVILAAYDEWGTGCFARLRGMWGLTLVDARRQTAVVSRDRLGIKPIYLAESDGLLAVASEIKQFFAIPAFNLRPDSDVLASYLSTGYEVPGRTFFDLAKPLPPGTWIEIDLRTGAYCEPQDFWFPERVEVRIDDPAEAARLFRAKLEESVRIHLRSDVPVGCALSGGLDSSSIAACVGELTAGSSQRFETFSVTFPGCAIDEQTFAEVVVKSIGCSPHFITPTPQGLLEDLDRWLWIQDEPVGSLAQYAAYALARLTREEHVPVTLNGQGGDEILGGYWQSYFMYLRSLLRGGHVIQLGQHLAGSLLPGGNPELVRQIPFILRRYRSRSRATLEVNGSGKLDPSGGLINRLMGMNDQQRRVYDVRQMYLPRLLRWDDRNFMAFGVEGRYPLLDHELIELALSFSPEMLFRRGWTKEPLRAGMKGLLPQDICRRRTKFGFETPQDAWLCDPLRPVIESWLKSDAPLWDYIARDQVRAIANHAWEVQGKREEPGQMVFRLFFADRWMRVFFNNQ